MSQTSELQNSPSGEPNDIWGNKLINYLIDSHEDCVLFCGKADFNLTAINEPAVQLFSLQRDGILGSNLFDILPDYLSDTLKDNIRNVAATSKDFAQNILLPGDVIYNIKVSVFMTSLVIVLKNLSKKFESLEENNFRMLFENMSSGFVYMKAVTDKNGEITDHLILDINPSFEIFFGKEKIEAVGKNISEVIPTFDESWIKILAKSAKTGSSFSGNFHFAPTNKYYEVRTYSPRKGYSAAVFNDIKAEMEIRNDLMVKNEISKAFAMGHNTDLYKVVLDLVLNSTESPFGYIGYLSKKGDIVCFARQDDNMEMSTDEHGNDRMEIDSNFPSYAAINSHEQVIGRNFLGHKILLATPVIDNDQAIGIIGTADSPKGYNAKSKNFIQGLANYISPLMAAEVKERNYRRDLVEAKDRAEESEKLKSSFLANISHEIRTPMNAISGFCELLAKADNITDKQQKYIAIIMKSCRQLLHIVEDIMDMSKLQTQQSKLNISPLHLNKMLDEVMNSMSPSAVEKRIDLEVIKGLDDDGAYIYADSYKLKKILESLISNGIKFTNVGSVKYGYRLDGENIIFSVADTGIGIRKELHEGIFSSFRQAENVMERKYSGVGIGLSISKGFVDLMGGKIWLESEPGNGSTFYVQLKYDPVN